MPQLEVRDLHVSYGKVRALQGVTLTVGEGEIVCIVGANGAGKSTVLKTVMGLVPAQAGEVRLGDRPLNKLAPPGIVRAGIALSPEGRRLFPEMTVEENLLMGAYQRDRGAASDTLADVYELFPFLSQRRRQFAATLSGGEQQMTAIGRALMSNPKVLLLDEPSLGVAPLVVREIVKLVRRIRERGVSVVLVEQNARMALKLSDRAYVLETGRVTLSGTGAELLGDEQVQRSYLGV